MTIGDKIRELRLSKGLRQKELAEKLGVTAQAVSMWEACHRDPNPAQRKKICHAFGISEAQLFGADTGMIPIQHVPVVSWVHANKLEEIHDPFPAGISDEYVYTIAKGKHIFALRVNNDCMSPEFNDGDIIIVNPHLEICNGDFVIVADRDDNKATFKQLKEYGKSRILHPLNPRYPDIELDHKKQYVIIGKVVEKIKRY